MLHYLQWRGCGWELRPSKPQNWLILMSRMDGWFTQNVCFYSGVMMETPSPFVTSLINLGYYSNPSLRPGVFQPEGTVCRVYLNQSQSGSLSIKACHWFPLKHNVSWKELISTWHTLDKWSALKTRGFKRLGRKPQSVKGVGVRSSTDKLSTNRSQRSNYRDNSSTQHLIYGAFHQ